MPFDHFSFLAPFYDSVIQPGRIEKILEMNKLPAEGTMLDVGGGTGRIAETIRPYVDHLIVADLSVGMLRQAHQKALTTVCSHSETLPFEDNAFERVLMVDALHHVCSQTETARELWRVLKPGGRLVIEEPDIRTFSVKLVALAEKLALMRSHFLPAVQIAALFNQENTKVQIFTQDHTAWVVVEKES